MTLKKCNTPFYYKYIYIYIYIYIYWENEHVPYGYEYFISFSLIYQHRIQDEDYEDEPLLWHIGPTSWPIVWLLGKLDQPYDSSRQLGKSFMTTQPYGCLGRHFDLVSWANYSPRKWGGKG